MTMDGLHVVLAALAGAGWALAWGYRTALAIAKDQSPPRPPEDRVATADFRGFGNTERRA